MDPTPVPETPAAVPTPDPSAMPSDADLVAAIEKEKPAEAPVAKAPEKTKEPEKPKESALMRSLQRREQDLVAKQQAFTAQQTRAAAEQQATISAGIDRALKERFADPRSAVKALQALGLTPQQLAEALVKPEAPSDGELARKALAEAQAIKTGLETEAAQRQVKAREQEFVTAAKSMADKLPHLFDEWTSEEILAEAYKFGRELQEECQREGKVVPDVPNERVLRVLDRRAKAKQTARLERIKAKSAAESDVKAAAQAAPKAAGANGSGHQGETTGAPATTTLGRGLGERQSVAVEDPVLMSNDDILAQVNKKLAEGLNIKAR